MTRISRPRLDPNPAPKRGSGPARITRKKRQKSENRKEREKRDAEYNALSDIAKEQNPECYYCGQPFEPTTLQCDHIASGGSRGASLLNFETINNTCAACHKENPPAHEKASAKLVHTIKTIMQKRGKAFTYEEDREILEDVETALMSGIDESNGAFGHGLER